MKARKTLLSKSCSCGGPWVWFLAAASVSSQLPMTPAPGNLMPPSALHSRVHTSIQNTCMYIIWNSPSNKKKVYQREPNSLWRHERSWGILTRSEKSGTANVTSNNRWESLRTGRSRARISEAQHCGLWNREAGCWWGLNLQGGRNKGLCPLMLSVLLVPPAD